MYLPYLRLLPPHDWVRSWLDCDRPGNYCLQSRPRQLLACCVRQVPSRHHLRQGEGPGRQQQQRGAPVQTASSRRGGSRSTACSGAIPGGAPSGRVGRGCAQACRRNPILSQVRQGRREGEHYSYTWHIVLVRLELRSRWCRCYYATIVRYRCYHTAMLNIDNVATELGTLILALLC